MKILHRRSAPRYRRPEGITSFLLASSRTCGARHLSATLVEIEPGGHQRVHSHDPEQIYFILEGRGVMRVGEEEREVEEGDCIFIPSRAAHGIENRTKGVLRYFSAASPPFGASDLANLWPLAPEATT